MSGATSLSKETRESFAPASTNMAEITTQRSEEHTKHEQNPQTDSESLQAGVQRAEQLRRIWSKTGLIIAFVGLFLATFAVNFADYSTQVYTAYTTSAFKQHSAMSAARVVMNITRIASYPIIAKLGDVFGRAEMFILSIFAQVLGYVIYACCKNISQYMAAGIFEAIGSTGYALTQQVFVADVTNLLNRGIWSTLPDSLTTIPTLYLGTIVAQDILDHSTWRWGGHRAPRRVRISTALGWKSEDPWWRRVYDLLWIQLDLPGAVLLLLGLSLFLIPLSLTGSGNSGAWRHNGSFIAMLVMGVVFVIAFLAWDAWFAKKPFVPYRMIRNRTVAAACLLGALDFFHYSVFTVFFTSYLQVAGHFEAGNATRIDNSLRVAFQVAGIFASLFMKYTRRSQIWVLGGVPLCVLGMGIVLYLVDMGNGKTGSEAAFVTAKSLIGIGRGFYQTAAQVSVQAVVSRQEVSVVTAVFFASMSVGGAIGTSVAGAIWRSTLPKKLEQYLPDALKSQAHTIFSSIVVAKKYQPGTAARDAIDRSYRESQRLLAIAALAALAPMLIVMFFLRNVHLDERNEEGEATFAETPVEKGHEDVQAGKTATATSSPAGAENSHRNEE